MTWRSLALRIRKKESENIFLGWEGKMSGKSFRNMWKLSMYVFNIHLCSVSYGKGYNLSKSVKQDTKIFLTFSSCISLSWSVEFCLLKIHKKMESEIFCCCLYSDLQSPNNLSDLKIWTYILLTHLISFLKYLPNKSYFSHFDEIVNTHSS